jgi:hypothetical protein
LPDPLPMNLSVSLVPALRSKEAPLTLRTAVAGRILTSAPDDPVTVNPIVTALTIGLSKLQTLDCLLELQRYVTRCETLDVLTEAAEAKTPLRCPRCDERHIRSRLIAHLWEEHRLVFVEGQAVEPRALLEPLISQAVTASAGDSLDAAYEATQTYYPEANRREMFQVLASRGPAEAAEADLLLATAEKDRCGLCPVCLHAVPDPIPALPPEACRSQGRISAEGYSVEIRETSAGRIAELTRREDVEELTQIGPGYAPRMLGVFAALGVFLLSLAAVLFAPAKWVSPWLVMGGGLVSMWLAYLFVRYTRPSLPDATDRALELAWSNLTPGIGRSTAAVRFLTRLCRLSLRTGDAAERSPAVYEIVEQAAVLADRAPQNWQLLAAARVLQATDGAVLGKERISALAKILTPFFRGEVSPIYADAAAELIWELGEEKPAELTRLAILLLEEAFANDMNTTDLLTITRFLPHLRRLLLGKFTDDLGLLHAVYEMRSGEAWKRLGTATTIFEFARKFPNESRKLLAAHPDALLIIETTAVVEAEVGMVVLTSRGLLIGPVLLVDPETSIEQQRASNDLWRLQLGTNRLPLNQKLPDRWLAVFRAWLLFRTTILIPAAEQDDRRELSSMAIAILTPLAITCPLCSTQAIHRTGRIGTPWQAITM